MKQVEGAMYIKFIVKFLGLDFEIVWDFPDMLQDYPANTVRGRICLGLRLDWDKDPGQVFSKETSDIYIKVGFVKKSCDAI